ncbi:MAG: response regulator [Chlorobi bacterium]|nr:response regulator [Chlorobiota bacterium]
MTAVKIFDLHKIDKWVEKIISYPGIHKEELTLRKDYWVGSVACLLIIVCLTLTFWIFYSEFRIMISYGVFMTAIFLLFTIAGVIIRRNLEWMMFTNQMLIIIGTFLFILKLGGIIYSGGLIFIGFFVVIFSFDFYEKRKSVWLFITYALTVLLAAILQPYLTVTPELTPGANLFLFTVNLFWISALAFAFLLNFISQRVEIEQKEAMRLKEMDELKTKLYTNITHEFRTPLTVILGMVELIRNQPGKWLRKGTLKVENNSKLLLKLVDQMLELSKLEAGEMPVTYVQGDIIFFMKQLVEMFRSLADKKKITLRYLPETNRFVMDYDPEKLMQIVSNLISNAIKYTGHGGKIDVIVRTTQTPSQRLEIKVKDNGTGISEDLLPHIFDRFVRIENDKKPSGREPGSGLGLAITRELIHLLDGTINVESVYGKGTEFIISLPVTHNAAFETTTDFLETEGMIHGLVPFSDDKAILSEKIAPNDKPLLLIVEDNVDVVDYLVALLEKDYSIRVAANGKEGWERALDLMPDIIVSDIMMPEMDGIELLDKIKNDFHTSHIPVVILTAKADIVSRLTGLKKGADVYLSKPFNKKELVIQLEKLIKLRKKLQERYANPGMQIGAENKEYKIEDSFVRKVRNFMLENLHQEEFNIKKLCYTVAMSRTQLYRKFKFLTNRTLFEYLQSLRLHRAKELLMTTDIPVSEAAWLTGFKNISHFSKVFTREFGVNPSKI